MNNTQQFYTLRPSLVFVPDSNEQYCHLRGGDNEIYPLQDITNQVLLQCVFITFRQKTIASFSDIKDTFIRSDYYDKQPSAAFGDELSSLLNTLIEAGLLFTLSGNQTLSSLQKLLIREGVYSDSLYCELQSKKVIVAINNTNQHKELIQLLGEYQFDITAIKINQDTIISPQTHLIVGYGNFGDKQYFQSIHEKSIQLDMPWIMLREAGFNLAQIGPIFVPQETACYRCLTRRMNSQRNNPEHHQQFESFVNSETILPPADSWPEAARSFIFSQIIIEITRYLISNTSPFPTKTLASKSRYFNLLTLQAETEVLLKLPSCPDCLKHSNSLLTEH